MSSGGGKTTTTTQASGPPQWAIPYFQSAISQASNIANQPYTPYGGARVADFTPDQYQGFDQIRQQATAGNPYAWRGMDFAGQQLQGNNAFTAQRNPYEGQGNPYATQNPYLDQMVSDSQADVTRSYQNSTLPGVLGQFNAGGAYGGTAMQQAMSQSNQDLAGQLGRVSTGLRNADYDRRSQLAESGLNRNAQLSDAYLGRQQSAWAQNQSNNFAALDRLPMLNDLRYADGRALMNIGQQQQGLMQGALDADYDEYRDWRDWDVNRLGALTNALGSIQGGASQQTGANPNYRSAGQNAAGYAALLASLWG